MADLKGMETVRREMVGILVDNMSEEDLHIALQHLNMKHVLEDAIEKKQYKLSEKKYG